MRRYLWWVAAVALLASEVGSNVANGQGARRDAIASVGRSTEVQSREYESARASKDESYRRLRGAATAEEPVGVRDVVVSWGDGKPGGDVHSPEEGGESRLSQYSTMEVSARRDPHDDAAEEEDERHATEVDGTGEESVLTRGRVVEGMVPWGAGEPQLPTYTDPEDTAIDHDELQDAEAESPPEQGSESTRERLTDGMVPWADGGPQLPAYTAPEKPTPEPYRVQDTPDEHDGQQNAEPEDYEQEVVPTRGRLTDGMVPWEGGGPQLPTYSATEELTPGPHRRDSMEAGDPDMDDMEESVSVKYAASPTYGEDIEHTDNGPGVEEHDGQLVSATGDIMDIGARWDQDDCYPCELPTSIPRHHNGTEHGDYIPRGGSVTEDEVTWDDLELSEPLYPARTIAPTVQPCESTPTPTSTPASTPSSTPASTPASTPSSTPASTTPLPDVVTPTPTPAVTTYGGGATTPTPTPAATTTTGGVATPTPTPAATTTTSDGSIVYGTSTGTETTDGKTTDSTGVTTSTSTTTTDTAYTSTSVNSSGTAASENGTAAATVTDVKTSTSTSDGSTVALSAGAIAGIIIGCVVLVAVIVGALVFRQRSLARQREANLFADLSDTGGALETDYAAM
ncbi:hypothetical protein BBJ28_00009663 [Nothophytophthora sp. Chile5]|nr:hypothetical protein BBJ28_00009663 [Nothophytophthora sp. Chile5]